MDKEVEDDSEEIEEGAERLEGEIEEGVGSLFDNLEDDNETSAEENGNSDSEE